MNDEICRIVPNNLQGETYGGTIMAATSRKDSKGRKLHTGESQRNDGIYLYRYTDAYTGKRTSVYANDLPELRRKEKAIAKDIDDNILTDASTKNLTLNTLFERYLGIIVIDDGTKINYQNMWNIHVRDTIGNIKVVNLRASHIMSLYSGMSNDKYAHNTIKYIHLMIFPALEMAVDDDIIRKNPSKNALSSEYGEESKKKEALDLSEQERLLNFMNGSKIYRKYIPLITIMSETALRCGELIGITFNDIDFKNKELRIDHQLTYKNYKDGNGCMFRIKKPKTKAGIRTIPLTDRACDAFREQRKQNFQAGIFCTFEIEGVTDFVFLTKNGRPMMPSALNNVLYNIVRNYNSCTDGTQTIEQFSSHVMRHTGCTNMARAGVNVKATQYVMGHAHSDVTMDVYNHLNNKTDVKLEFSKFEKNGTKMVQ